MISLGKHETYACMVHALSNNFRRDSNANAERLKDVGPSALTACRPVSVLGNFCPCASGDEGSSRRHVEPRHAVATGAAVVDG